MDIAATGIGGPAVTAARRLVDDSANRTIVIENNKGHVLVIDISSQMLLIAKQRAVSLGLQINHQSVLKKKNS